MIDDRWLGNDSLDVAFGDSYRPEGYLYEKLITKILGCAFDLAAITQVEDVAR
jgi:hypothetical protein